MPNFNPLIYSAAEFKLILLINGHPYPLFTADNMSFNTAEEGETIYAIGTEEPIGEKKNAKSYKGKVSVQLGELNIILVAEGLTNAIQISNAQLGFSTTDGLIQRIFGGMNILSEDIDIKRKDKETIVPMNWAAVSQN
jgi:hypothetical protein